MVAGSECAGRLWSCSPAEQTEHSQGARFEHRFLLVSEGRILAETKRIVGMVGRIVRRWVKALDILHFFDAR